MQDKIYSIYTISNTSNKVVYIGWTSKKPEDRWKQHKNSKTNTAISRAIRKYKNDLSFNVIYQSKDIEHSKKMEIFFINFYDTFKNGYNLTYGGDGTIGYKHKDSTRELISRIVKSKGIKRNWTDLQKKELSNKLKGHRKTIEAIENNRISQCKWSYLITFKDDRCIIVNSLNQFCLNNNYQQASLQRLFRNKQKSAYDIKSIVMIEPNDVFRDTSNV